MSKTEYWAQLEEHAAGVFSPLVRTLYHLAGVSTSVFGFTTNFSDGTAKPISQITTVFIMAFTCGTAGLPSSHLLFPGVPRHVFVLFFGPCFGHFSSLECSTGGSPAGELASAAAVVALPSAARRAASAGENGVDSKHSSESRQHDSSLLFSRR